MDFVSKPTDCGVYIEFVVICSRHVVQVNKVNHQVYDKNQMHFRIVNQASRVGLPEKPNHDSDNKTWNGTPLSVFVLLFQLDRL